LKKRIEPHLIIFLIIDFLICLSLVILVKLKKG
jgi:type IV secretory pathway component VirB8